MLILIGSAALIHHRSDLVTRTPKDFDFIGTYSDIQDYIKNLRNYYDLKEIYYTDKGKKIVVKGNAIRLESLFKSYIAEFEIAWPGSSAEKYLSLKEHENLDNYYNQEGHFRIAPVDDLLAFKMSHRFLKNSKHFVKTREDILKMQQAGITVPDSLKEWIRLREKETYNYSHPKLNQSKDSFFNKNEGVNYIYDHDSIHIAMAYYEKPAYTFFKKPNSDVMCDKLLWDRSGELTKRAAVLEESYVLALERSQIPFPDMNRKKSFVMALQKVCTSITSGWFREFAWQNYDNVLSMYDSEYVARFNQAVSEGVVRKL